MCDWKEGDQVYVEAPSVKGVSSKSCNEGIRNNVAATNCVVLSQRVTYCCSQQCSNDRNRFIEFVLVNASLVRGNNAEHCHRRLTGFAIQELKVLRQVVVHS